MESEIERERESPLSLFDIMPDLRRNYHGRNQDYPLNSIGRSDSNRSLRFFIIAFLRRIFSD
jgi:hypothetical protein